MLKKILSLLFLVSVVVLGIILLSNHFMVKFVSRAGTPELRSLEDLHQKFETKLHTILLTDSEDPEFYRNASEELSNIHASLNSQTEVVINENFPKKRFNARGQGMKNSRDHETETLEEVSNPAEILEKIGRQKGNLVKYIESSIHLREKIKGHLKHLMDYSRPEK